MSYLRIFLALLCVLALAASCLAKPLDNYIAEATKLQQAGDLIQALAVLEAADKEYPASADVYAFKGLYTGMKAGTTQNIMEAGQLAGEAFTLLDRAVAIDPLNVNARFHRGIMGVRVPQFMGRLDGALEDLEAVATMHGDSPDRVPTGILTTTYDLLGEGYEKKGDPQKAEATWRKLMELAPGSASANDAEAKIAGLTAGAASPAGSAQASGAGAAERTRTAEVKGGPQDVPALVEKARAAMDAGNYTEAIPLLKQAAGLDPQNASTFKMLGASLAYADRGYDKNIAEDTTQRTSLVFESIGYLDKAVSLAPDDLEARLLRGALGVSFPFFANKLEQGIADLEMVVGSNSPDSVKAQAKYWLGVGYQKKGMSYWTQVVNDDQDQEAVRLALAGMRPSVDHFDRSRYAGPVVVVDFVLGFRDELAPQTAVWVEDSQGKFLRTVYISGFSGNAKGAQVVLPEYARISGYGDADAVTGASIDIGHHIYVWDLTDQAGKRVEPGNYTVKVEVSYWPSMKYQIESAAVRVGAKDSRTVVEKGNYLPYLEVEYLP